MSSRDEILGRVRSALAGTSEGTELPAVYEHAGHGEQRETLGARFERGLCAAGAQLHRVSDTKAAAQVFARLVRELELVRMTRSDSPLLIELCSAAEGVQWVEASPFPTNADERAPLFDVQAGLSTAQLAIAETGTLCLDSSAELHRLASLVPPVHFALVHARDIVPHMSAAIAHFESHGLPPSLTFITGPSRTADIELELVVGVHGPRELHVLLIDDQASSSQGKGA